MSRPLIDTTYLCTVTKVCSFPSSLCNATDISYQAEIFLHEMFHVDIISSAPPNHHVSDLWIRVEDVWEIVDGPEMAKVLARVSLNTGQWVMQSADNLMHFAMTLYYQGLLHGEYPSRPFAGGEPDDGTRPHKDDPSRHNPSMFDFSNNTLQVSNRTAFSIRAQKSAPTYDASLGETPVIITAATAKFAANTDYPASYQSSLSSWKSTWDAYLATATASGGSPSSSTPKTTAAQPPPSPTGATADTCGVQYEFILDHFKIQGKNFNAAKFGKDGSGLKVSCQSSLSFLFISAAHVH